MKFADVPHIPTNHDRLVDEAKKAIDLVFTDLDVEPEETAKSLDDITEHITHLRAAL